MNSNLPKKETAHRDITVRDLNIMKYLWKWKLVSTAGLGAKFYPNLSILTPYRRLLRLADSNYLQFIHDNDASGCGWSLTSKGFKKIRHLLGELRAEGFKSEYPHHDRLATAFHLGDWLTEQPEYTQTFSEQQLRRVPVDVWDDWVPKSESHRPDGYSLMFNGDERVVFAFEVEMSLKPKPRYESVAVFYDLQQGINAVFWLVNSRSTANSLKRYLESFNVRDIKKHNFVVTEEFQTLGWSAPIIEGKFKGKLISDILLRLPSTKPPLSRHQGGGLKLLNNFKKPISSSP